jgi:hypothetical protein
MKIISRAVFFCAGLVITKFIDESITQLYGRNLDPLPCSIQFRVSVSPLVILGFRYFTSFELRRHLGGKRAAEIINTVKAQEIAEQQAQQAQRETRRNRKSYVR